MMFISVSVVQCSAALRSAFADADGDLFKGRDHSIQPAGKLAGFRLRHAFLGEGRQGARVDGLGHQVAVTVGLERRDHRFLLTSLGACEQPGTQVEQAPVAGE